MAMTFGVNGGGDFKRVPPGSHVAICNLVAWCGLQTGSAQYPEPKTKLYWRFEVPAERVQFDRDGVPSEGPMTIGTFVTASMHEKSTMRKYLESWRGRKFTDMEASAFDVSAILGKAALLTVQESVRGDRTYSNIAAIGPLPKGLQVAAAENPLLLFEPDSPDSALQALPQWLRERINRRLDQREVPPLDGAAKAAPSGAAADGFEDDEIPF